jgi:hypothetical protein
LDRAASGPPPPVSQLSLFLTKTCIFFSSRPCHDRALDNIVNFFKLFLAVRAISQNRYDREWMGLGEKDKRRTGYADLGGRCRGGGAEAKPLASGLL